MTPFLVSICAGAATLVGGSVALRLRDRLHLILGFSAGAVIAVAFFDLIPEALELAGDSFSTSTIVAFVALGFVLYLLLDRLLLLHSHAHEDGDMSRGHVRAGSISLHSFLDGIGIGLAFQVSTAVGAIVALAVLAHDFSDGINTVNVISRENGSPSSAWRWLIVDAAAPIVGVGLTFFFSIPVVYLGLLLALFAGFFLYIGASDLVPESHHAHPTLWTTAMTILGVGALYVVIRLAGI